MEGLGLGETGDGEASGVLQGGEEAPAEGGRAWRRHWEGLDKGRAGLPSPTSAQPRQLWDLMGLLKRFTLGLRG